MSPPQLTTRSKEATNLTKLVQEKDQIIRDLHNQIEMCQKVCAEKSEKIAELDKECEDMLSWGKSVEQNHSDLANRLGGLLKDLADSKMKVFAAGVEKILLLVCQFLLSCVIAIIFLVFANLELCISEIFCSGSHWICI